MLKADIHRKLKEKIKSKLAINVKTFTLLAAAPSVVVSVVKATVGTSEEEACVEPSVVESSWVVEV